MLGGALKVLPLDNQTIWGTELERDDESLNLLTMSEKEISKNSEMHRSRQYNI